MQISLCVHECTTVWVSSWPCLKSFSPHFAFKDGKNRGAECNINWENKFRRSLHFSAGWHKLPLCSVTFLLDCWMPKHTLWAHCACVHTFESARSVCTLPVQVGSINKVKADGGLLSMGCTEQEERNKHLSPSRSGGCTSSAETPQNLFTLDAFHHTCT